MIIGQLFFDEKRFAVFRYLDEGIRLQDPENQNPREISFRMVVRSSFFVDRVPRNSMKRTFVWNTTFYRSKRYPKKNPRERYPVHMFYFGGGIWSMILGPKLVPKPSKNNPKPSQNHPRPIPHRSPTDPPSIGDPLKPTAARTSLCGHLLVPTGRRPG